MFLFNVVVVLSVAVTLVAAQSGARAGDCPPPTGLGVCYNMCYSDSQCASPGKCCPTNCGGTVCTRPVTMRRPNVLSEKAGSCPSRPGGPWICSSMCVYDGDCRGRLKCCKNRCGAMACQKPEI